MQTEPRPQTHFRWPMGNGRRDVQVPETWVRELMEREAPQLTQQFTFRMPEEVTLSYHQNTGKEFDLAKVCSDISASAEFSRWETKTGEPRFALTGQHFRIVLKPARGRNSGRNTAQIIAIEPNPAKTLRDWDVQGEISAQPVWDEVECDLAALWKAAQMGYDQWKKVRQRAWQEKRREIRHVEQVDFLADEHRLHDLARKNYGALRAMMDLLETRARVEQAAEAEGTVELLPSPEENRDEPAPGLLKFLLVRVASRTGQIEEGDRVAVVPEGGRGFRSRIEQVEGDLIYLPLADGGTLKPGIKVTVTVQPRFSMTSHSRALKRFLAGDVAGNWADLATLLCRPEKLRLGVAPIPEKFYAEEEGRTLNGEQKRAVAGALASPHAFLIQGPPGTGKTTVITEIVQHLVERGERILMLAPTHVAVDEVLRRVGQKPGVLPVRLAWSDMKVDASVRQFTLTNVARELVKKIRQPSASRAQFWKMRTSELMREVDGVEKVLAAVRQHADAMAADRRTRYDLETFTAEFAQQRITISAELDEVHKKLPRLEAQRDTAKKETAALQDAAAALRKESGGWGKALAFVGVGELAEAEKQAAKAGETMQELKRQVKQLGKQRTDLEEMLQKVNHEMEAGRRKREKALNSAGKALQSALRQRSSTFEELGIADGSQTPEQLEARRHSAEERLRRIQQYPELEQRWFEITGMSGENGRNAVEDVAQQIGKDLLDIVNLVCCTTTGIASQQMIRETSFDTLIVDEASRVTDSEFLIGAVRARRWILVGDERQLPPYVEPADEYHLHATSALQRAGTSGPVEKSIEELAVLWKEDEEQHRFREESVLKVATAMQTNGLWAKEYQPEFKEALRHFKKRHEHPERALLQTMRDYLVRSLFERCVAQCLPELRVRLAVQRRMIEPIARIVAQPIYGGEYHSPPPEELAKDGVVPLINATFRKPVVFLDTSLHRKRALDVQDGSGFINRLEAEWVVRACKDYDRALRGQNSPRITVSILCFYRAQAREIRKRLGWPQPALSKLDFRVIDAIDRIQGQESDLVIISFCRTHSGHPGPGFGQWLQDIRRLNVACTRAHRALVLVGHAQTLRKLCSNEEAQGFYRNLFELFEKHPECMEMNKNYESDEK